REHAATRADLEHDVAAIEGGQSLDHAEDVFVDEEVLAELLPRRDVHSPNAAVALASMRAASSAALSARTRASSATVWTTFAGSFRGPRTGCGARDGLSVSARGRAAGTRGAPPRRAWAAGEVRVRADRTRQ